MDQLQDTVVAGNALITWITALAVAVLSFVVLRVIIRVLRGRLTRLAAATHNDVDDAVVAILGQTRGFAFLIAALYLGSLVLTVPPVIEGLAAGITTLLLLFQVGLWVNAGLAFVIKRYGEQREEEGDAAAATMLSALGYILRLVLWSVVVLIALDNLGVDVTALVAGLGVGGIAVALAVQNVLGDLLASLSIVFDRPFVIGDFIVIGEHLGSVEHVGLKTTRVRSLSGEQLVFSNNDLLGSRIRNYGRMFERRVLFTIGVTYDTPREKLRLIPGILRDAVESQENTRFDRAHFHKYGDFSLNFETVYYVLVPDYGPYMDIHQAINFQIHERFESEGIEFAFPTQTIHLVGSTAA